MGVESCHVMQNDKNVSMLNEDVSVDVHVHIEREEMEIPKSTCELWKTRMAVSGVWLMIIMVAVMLLGAVATGIYAGVTIPVRTCYHTTDIPRYRVSHCQ